MELPGITMNWMCSIGMCRASTSITGCGRPDANRVYYRGAFGEAFFPEPSAARITSPLFLERNGANMNGEVVRNGIYVCVIEAGSNSARFRIAVAK